MFLALIYPGGFHFSNQYLRLHGPVVEKAKGLGMTPGTSFHKGQPCPTSSASNAYSAHD